MVKVLKLKNACTRCNSYTYEIRRVNMHTGLYCKCCGIYIKWLSKKEKLLYGVDEIINDTIVKKENDVDIAKYCCVDERPVETDDLPFD